MPVDVAMGRNKYDSLTTNLAKSIAFIGKPLKNLNEEQAASLAALLVVTRQAALMEGYPTKTTDKFSGLFWTEIQNICPPLKKFEIDRGGCIDEHIAYASAMASCLAEEGKTEEDCERENWPEGAAVTDCIMHEMEKMKGLIGKIGGRVWPPKPFPWP